MQKATDAKSQAEKELNSARDEACAGGEGAECSQTGTAKCEGCSYGRAKKDTAEPVDKTEIQ